MVTDDRWPFGHPDCESELHTLRESEYAELFFAGTPFSSAAIKPETYLIVGRRGSGKTALAQYFAFQSVIPNPLCIRIDEPHLFQQVLSEFADRIAESRETAIPRMSNIWMYLLWTVIFDAMEPESPQGTSDTGPHAGRVARLVEVTLQRLLSLFEDASARSAHRQVEELLTDSRFESRRESVLQYAARRPIILVVDTLEKYDVSDGGLMNATAALIQCAAQFNLLYTDRGVHLKGLRRR